MTGGPGDPSGEEPVGSGAAAGETLAPRRFRRSTISRSHAFGVFATAALFLPTLAGVRWGTWPGPAGGAAGGLVAIATLAAFFFGFPPVAASAPARAGQMLTRASCALGCSIPFLAIALAEAGDSMPGAGALAVGWFALAALAGVSRRGTLASTAFVLAVFGGIVAVGSLRSSLPPPAVEGAATCDVARVRLELTGPLRSAAISADGLPPLRLHVDLVAGEVLETFAWIAAPADRGRFEVAFTVTEVDPASAVAEGGASRVVVRFDEPVGRPALADDPLAARPRPALPPTPARAPSIDALLLAWVAVFVSASLAGRYGSSRPWLASVVSLGVGGLAGLGALWLSLDGLEPLGVVAPDMGVVRVLEGTTGADGATRWVQVDRGDGVLAMDVRRLTADARLEIADSRPLVTRLRSIGDEQITSVWAHRGVGIDLLRPLSPGLRLLQPEVNTWGDLAMVWARDAAGSWSEHGPWAFGEPLPASLGSAEPPAWCVLGLETGRAALVGRLGAGSFVGAGVAPRVTWIRLTW